MQRISSNLQFTDLQRALRRQEARIGEQNGKIANQSAISSLRDDPLAAGHSVRYKSYLARLERFDNNAKTLSDRYRAAEGYMSSSMGVLQRVRELAVAGANGIYTASDLGNMASEVDELLQELLVNANATGPDGARVFAGLKSFTEPFEAVWGNVSGAGSPVIQEVRYNGSLGEKSVEVDEGAFLEAEWAGNRTFWAEPQALYSQVDARAFVVPADTSITVDGIDIPLAAGDTVYAVISKINSSGAAAKASLDPVTSGLNLVTTDIRQLWLMDGEGGSTLSALGLIQAGQRPPYNISPQARVSGGSMFDAVIALRDAMLSGDNETIGGKVLGALDGAIENLSARMAELGSRHERAESVTARLAMQTLNTQAADSREADLDFTKAVTDLKMLEYAHQAALSTAGKLYSTTLLNYLR